MTIIAVAWRLMAAGIAAFLAISPAGAEVQKILRICDGKLCPVFRVNLPVPGGWREDEEAGRKRNIQVLVPKGETFNSAEAIIYATVRYNAEREPIVEFVARAQARWLERVPDATIARLADVRRAGIQPFYHYVYEAPGLSLKGFEHVATTADTDRDGNPFVVVIVMTGLSKAALAKAEEAYLSILRNY